MPHTQKDMTTDALGNLFFGNNMSNLIFSLTLNFKYRVNIKAKN